MTHSKWLISLLAAASLHVAAESQRTIFTVENRFPRWEQVEVGVLGTYEEYDFGFTEPEIIGVMPYVRYGIREHFAVQVGVPYVQVDPGFGSSESGLGDVEVKFQLRAYEDIFGYPYFIPHLSVTFPTGDDEKGLGAGDATVTAGLSYGNKIYDFISYVLDGSYRIHPDQDNQVLLSTSFLWHVSAELDFIAEVRYEDNTGLFGEDESVYFLGGMVYDWTRALQMGVHAGTAISGDDETFGLVRFSYSF